jgi:hypothetical protein
MIQRLLSGGISSFGLPKHASTIEMLNNEDGDLKALFRQCWTKCGKEWQVSDTCIMRHRGKRHFSGLLFISFGLCGRSNLHVQLIKLLLHLHLPFAQSRPPSQ